MADNKIRIHNLDELNNLENNDLFLVSENNNGNYIEKKIQFQNLKNSLNIPNVKKIHEHPDGVTMQNNDYLLVSQNNGAGYDDYKISFRDLKDYINVPELQKYPKFSNTVFFDPNAESYGNFIFNNWNDLANYINNSPFLSFNIVFLNTEPIEIDVDIINNKLLNIFSYNKSPITIFVSKTKSISNFSFENLDITIKIKNDNSTFDFVFTGDLKNCNLFFMNLPINESIYLFGCRILNSSIYSNLNNIILSETISNDSKITDVKEISDCNLVNTNITHINLDELKLEGENVFVNCVFDNGGQDMFFYAENFAILNIFNTTFNYNSLTYSNNIAVSNNSPWILLNEKFLNSNDFLRTAFAGNVIYIYNHPQWPIRDFETAYSYFENNRSYYESIGIKRIEFFFLPGTYTIKNGSTYVFENFNVIIRSVSRKSARLNLMRINDIPFFRFTKTENTTFGCLVSDLSFLIDDKNYSGFLFDNYNCNLEVLNCYFYNIKNIVNSTGASTFCFNNNFVSHDIMDNSALFAFGGPQNNIYNVKNNFFRNVKYVFSNTIDNSILNFNNNTFISSNNSFLIKNINFVNTNGLFNISSNIFRGVDHQKNSSIESYLDNTEQIVIDNNTAQNSSFVLLDNYPYLEFEYYDPNAQTNFLMTLNTNRIPLQYGVNTYTSKRFLVNYNNLLKTVVFTYNSNIPFLGYIDLDFSFVQNSNITTPNRIVTVYLRIQLEGQSSYTDIPLVNFVVLSGNNPGRVFYMFKSSLVKFYKGTYTLYINQNSNTSFTSYINSLKLLIKK